uniref:Mobile element protein n=1 Tax=uncultured Armatimonadetes bacterium TaxID=157466 RepID=A0A6J4JFE4_9BACT|nr:Mobile element protein [uncultured Armatimonadetes bacterium]
MPWKETAPMQERAKLVALYLDGRFTMTELCQHFGVSRRTGYKWAARFEEAGPEGLKDQSRAPHRCPHRTGEQTQELLLAAKRARPSWGPKKLLAYLRARHPDVALPAPSTAGALFARQGLTKRKRRRGWPHPGATPLQAEEPNRVWCADFKGQFKTGDGLYCFPLTVSDACSRYLLAVDAYLSTQTSGARATFERLFRECGLPAAMRTDNGAPFATTGLRGLSRLSVWWMRLGIAHQRIEPGKPQQNGRHERMHKTLKEEATKPGQKDRAAQQERFDAFRAEFNGERPHEALGQRTPASLYAPSPRPFPARLPEPEYPSHFVVRLVSGAGTFRLKGWQKHIGEALAGEYIGLEEMDEGLWGIYFCDTALARFDEKDGTVRG